MSEQNGDGPHAGQKKFQKGAVFPLPGFLCPECKNLIAATPVGTVKGEQGIPLLAFEGPCECRVWRLCVPPVGAQYVDKPKITLPGDI